MSGIRFTCALVTARDMAKSRYFYETMLGQKVKFDFGQNVTFEGDFAIHNEEHFLSLLGSTRPSDTAGPGPVELYFETEEIEKIHRRLRDAQVDFIHDITEQPWGQRVMRLYDPDRRIVEIGEPMEAVIRRFRAQGMDADEIAARTSMPEDVIKKVIETD